MSQSRTVIFFKAAAIPMAAWAATTALALALVFVPFAWRGSVYSAVWYALPPTGSFGLLVSAVVGWLSLRRRLQTRTALILLLPYLVVVAIGLVAGFLVTMTITGDGL
jgi:hypothetical protein